MMGEVYAAFFLSGIEGIENETYIIYSPISLLCEINFNVWLEEYFASMKSLRN